MNRFFHSILFASFAGLGGIAAADDMVIADFEQPNFKDWTVTGTAFGDGPASGALKWQMEVTGFQGKGFASGFHGGDDATGKMVLKAPFRIERGHMNFLIGGGGYGGETCMNLLVNGKVVRTATGTNVKPGGEEKLFRQSWDTREFVGLMGTLEIVDTRQGNWAHLSVDHIVQSDQSRQDELPKRVELRKELPITARYLVWPVRFDSLQVHTLRSVWK